jgi:hypothetical protein
MSQWLKAEHAWLRVDAIEAIEPNSVAGTYLGNYVAVMPSGRKYVLPNSFNPTTWLRLTPQPKRAKSKS